MTSTVASKPDKYRRCAEDCWKFSNDAEDIESKALFQLTAKAWTTLAAQVETLEDAHGSEAATTLPLLQFASRQLRGVWAIFSSSRLAHMRA
jgi:hypothetical protein